MNKQPNRGKRDRMVGVWCDDDEFSFIESEAKNAGVSKGNFCRQVVLGKLPQPGNIDGPISRKEFKDLHRELAAIGNNINQLAKKANTLDQLPGLKVLEEISKDISRIGDKLLEEIV